jgi:hypothetical protein
LSTEPGRIWWEPVTSTSIAVETGHVGLLPGHSFVIYSPEAGQTGLTVTSQLPGQQHHRYTGDRVAELKAVAEHWLEDHVAALGAAYDLASTFPPEVSACRFCNALLRQSQDGLYCDIDLNCATNPWQCSGRYVASPGGRHKPMGHQQDAGARP